MQEGRMHMATNIPELKAECIRNNITLEELAARIGINSATLHRKMTGRSEFLRRELQAIKDILHLNDERFLFIFFSYKLAETQEK